MTRILFTPYQRIGNCFIVRKKQQHNPELCCKICCQERDLFGGLCIVMAIELVTASCRVEGGKLVSRSKTS